MQKRKQIEKFVSLDAIRYAQALHSISREVNQENISKALDAVHNMDLISASWQVRNFFGLNERQFAPYFKHWYNN